VKDGSFIVGDRALFNQGVTYYPGELYPTEGERTLYALYETNQITVAIDDPKPPKKKKKRQED
jgi:hypothetical protein